MNNFFLNQPDPLLHNGMYENIPQSLLLQQMQQQQQFKDIIGELDESLKSLSPSMVERLSQNQKFSIDLELYLFLQLFHHNDHFQRLKGLKY